MYVGFDSTSITNYNQIDFVIELDLIGAPAPQYWTWVRVDTSPITTANQGIYADFVSQSYDQDTGYWYLNFHIENLDYNTTYYCSADVRENNDTTATIVMSSLATVQTQPDPTYIYNVTINQKKHKAFIDITIHVLTNDQYGVTLEYNRIETPQILRNAIFISGESNPPYYVFHYRIINLAPNKKYQYKITLNNLTHNQVVQTLSDEFTSLPDRWKLWMYLHYYI